MFKSDRFRLTLIVTLWSLAMLSLGLATRCFGQAIDSSQAKFATNGGLVGDSSNAMWVAPYRGASAPSSPVTGALWCDTNTTPCILKQYTGSTWTTTLSSASVATQANASSFPGSPSDGQMFFSKSPRALYIYDGTAAAWYTLAFPMNVTAPTIVDAYTSTAITKPGALTNTASATAGSTSTGAYSYKVTFANSTGGETDGGTVSGNASPGASKSNDLSNIPTGGTGTTQRRIYRSKANQNVTGPWYWVATINDNSTTTLNDGVADASLVLQIPEVNYSGALPGAWAVKNASTSATSGGCGVSASRVSMICMSSNTLQVVGTATSDASLRATLDLSSYTAGNFTIRFRLVKIANVIDSSLGVTGNNAIMCWRVGDADNAIRACVTLGGFNNAASASMFTNPPSSTNRPRISGNERNTIGAAGFQYALANPMPRFDSYPIWVKLVKRGTVWRAELSMDGQLWTPTVAYYSASSDANGPDNSSGQIGAQSWNQFDLDAMLAGGNFTSPAAKQTMIEIDNFTLTVD